MNLKQCCINLDLPIILGYIILPSMQSEEGDKLLTMRTNQEYSFFSAGWPPTILSLFLLTRGTPHLQPGAVVVVGAWVVVVGGWAGGLGIIFIQPSVWWTTRLQALCVWYHSSSCSQTSWANLCLVQISTASERGGQGFAIPENYMRYDIKYIHLWEVDDKCIINHYNWVCSRWRRYNSWSQNLVSLQKKTSKRRG